MVLGTPASVPMSGASPNSVGREAAWWPRWPPLGSHQCLQDGQQGGFDDNALHSSIQYMLSHLANPDSPVYTFLLRGLSEIDKYGPPLYTLVRRGYDATAFAPCLPVEAERDSGAVTLLLHELHKPRPRW